MTVNEYLWRLEWLQIVRDRKYKYCLELTERLSSPQSSLQGDGTPRAKDPHVREKMLIEGSEALEKYYAAADAYWNYKTKLLDQIYQLEYRHRTALEYKYVLNLDRPAEKRDTGIAKELSIRRKEVPALIREAKAQFRQLLISEGIEVE